MAFSPRGLIFLGGGIYPRACQGGTGPLPSRQGGTGPLPSRQGGTGPLPSRKDAIVIEPVA